MERAMRLTVALIIGVVTGFAVSYAAPALDWGFSVNAAAPAQAVQWVDRAHKGDRLDRPVAREIPATRIGKQPSPPQKLLVGCEPVASPLTGSQATIPGRCVG
jgi:hypothetical protein